MLHIWLFKASLFVVPIFRAANLRRARDAKAGRRQAERLGQGRAAGPLPFAPIIKELPILAFDHSQGRIDGHDKPHMLDDILHPSVMHKCLSDFDTFMVNSIRRCESNQRFFFVYPLLVLIICIHTLA